MTEIPFNSGGDFHGLVLEFNLPPSAYASMVIRELMKVDNSAVIGEENGSSEHSLQAAVKSSISEESRKKRCIVSEITSSDESSLKPREKRFKLCDLS